MEKRKEPRFADDTPVMVTVLESTTSSPIRGRVENMSGSGLRLKVSSPIAYGAVVKVEGADLLVLGDVCGVSGTGLSGTGQAGQATAGHVNGHGFEFAVQIAQAVGSLSALESFHRTLLGDSGSTAQPNEDALQEISRS
jgi:PilZ domain